jgi:head-tail adaptor
MRQKIIIQERVMTGQDSYGQPVYEWRDLFSCWAQLDAESNVTIKYRDDIRRSMQAILNSTAFIVGSTQEVSDGGVHLLKLNFSSARGVFVRARNVPKAAALPSTHDEASNEDSGS